METKADNIATIPVTTVDVNMKDVIAETAEKAKKAKEKARAIQEKRRAVLEGKLERTFGNRGQTKDELVELPSGLIKTKKEVEGIAKRKANKKSRKAANSQAPKKEEVDEDDEDVKKN